MKNMLFGALVCAVCLLASCRAQTPEVTLPDASSPQSSSASQSEPQAPTQKGDVSQPDNSTPPQPDGSTSPYPDGSTPSLVEPNTPAAAEPDLGWNSFSAQKQVDPPAVDPDPAARAAFAALLEERLPEGGQFALCDVTGLGTEDLILFQGSVCTVYSYFPESGALECVLEESANILFFENGSAVVPWSHNAGKGGRFWPYIHYRYIPAYQVYSPVDNVDAFDRQIAEDNGFLDQYPQEVDTSNAGFVYYFIDGEGQYTDPVDLSYYRDWWKGYFHNVSPMKLPLWDLTAASISALT